MTTLFLLIGGPLFAMIGGEGPDGGGFIDTGALCPLKHVATEGHLQLVATISQKSCAMVSGTAPSPSHSSIASMVTVIRSRKR